MSNIGTVGIVALVVIVVALLVWIVMTIRADRISVKDKKNDGKLKRGPVSGGAIHGDPGQSILTGEAPRQDEPRRNGPLDL
jgi:hypothetical protein